MQIGFVVMVVSLELGTDLLCFSNVSVFFKECASESAIRSLSESKSNTTNYFENGVLIAAASVWAIYVSHPHAPL
jgi:hypothetical protein